MNFRCRWIEKIENVKTCEYLDYVYYTENIIIIYVKRGWVL